MGKFQELARLVTELLEMGEALDAPELVDLVAALKPSADAAAKCNEAGCCSFGQRRSSNCACSGDNGIEALQALEEAGRLAQRAQKTRKPEPVEPALCNNCSGSGEGQFEGNVCRACKGRGEVAL